MVAMRCSPQSAVDVIQICRRSTWTNHRVYDVFQSLKLIHAFNNEHSTCTPDSQLVTWCSIGQIRGTLRMVPGPGLKNVGNTCYTNSILQILFYTDRFREILLRGSNGGGGGNEHGGKGSGGKGGSGGGAVVPVQQQPLLLSLQYLFTAMALSCRPHIEEDTINRFRRHLNNDYNSYQQQDAAEFTKYLLNTLADTCHLKACTELFGGAAQTSVECCVCGKRTVREETFMELSLSLDMVVGKSGGGSGGGNTSGGNTRGGNTSGGNTSGGNTSGGNNGGGNNSNLSSSSSASTPTPLNITDLISNYQADEVLETPNRYRCSGDFCNGALVERAIKKTIIVEWPSHFVVSMKRFYYSNGNILKKFNAIAFHNDMFVATIDGSGHNNTTGSNNGNGSGNTKRTIQYKLYGVVVHIGTTASSGHYIAYVTHSSTAEWRATEEAPTEGHHQQEEAHDDNEEGPALWWRCDDSTVTQAKGRTPWAQDGQTSTPYMMFYKRVGGGSESLRFGEGGTTEHGGKGEQHLHEGNGEGGTTTMMEVEHNGVGEEETMAGAWLNALSVPKEFVEQLKKDNVRAMLDMHHEMLAKMHSNK